MPECTGDEVKYLLFAVLAIFRSRALAQAVFIQDVVWQMDAGNFIIVNSYVRPRDSRFGLFALSFRKPHRQVLLRHASVTPISAAAWDSSFQTEYTGSGI